MVPRRRVRRRLRLAGHRLDRGPRPPPGRTRRLQPWWQGKTKWTDPAIKTAFQTFGDVVANSYGGATAVNATNFANAGDPLFKTPPGCLFLHQASFITGLGGFKTATAGTDYNFFPFPDINASTPARSRARVTCSACSTTRRQPSP